MDNQANEINIKEYQLRRLISDILSKENIDEAIYLITEGIGKMYDADRVYIRYYDSLLKVFTDVIGEYRKYESVPSAKIEVTASTALDEYLYSELIEKRKTIVIDNIDEAQLPEQVRILWKSLNIKTEIIVPIFYQGNFLAAFFMSCPECTKPVLEEFSNLLDSIADQIGAAMNMFNLNVKLKSSVAIEETIREVIYEIRKFDDHDEIFNYILSKIPDMFNVLRALHLHYDKENNLTVKNEIIKDHLDPLIHKPILTEKSTEELEPKVFREIIIINNVDSDINDTNLKNFLIKYGIQSFMLYPKSGRYPHEISEKVNSSTMVCSQTPRRWTSYEALNLKLLIDSAIASYSEIAQRHDYEDLRQTFLATLTHDLKSPLIGEQKALEMILSKHPEAQLSSFSEYLGEMHSTNENLLHLVGNILTVYQYESGDVKLNLQANNIADIIYDAVSSVRPLAEENESKIVTNIEPDLPLVMIDKNEILRVIINLLSNAIKHNKKNTAITISAERLHGEVEVSVRDNGSGIPESEKSKIFERYPTEKRKIGSGLGLYISNQIIDTHKGRIWFDTEVEKGTTFYFTLPIT